MANNNVIKKIKIKQADGTFSDYYPIGANAQNVTTAAGDDLETLINKAPRYYDTVAAMKADDSLKAGDVAVTLGYYEANDGGGAEYKIYDNGTILNIYETLINGNRAVVIIKDDIINVKQFGCKGNDNNFDNINIITTLITKFPTFTLYFPHGIYKISAPIVVPQGNNSFVNIKMDATTVLSATQQIATAIDYGTSDVGGTYNRRNANPVGYIQGGIIDCSLIYDGIKLNSNRQLTQVSYVTFKNISHCGLNCALGTSYSSGDFKISYCNFFRQDSYDATGIYSSCHDNEFQHIRIDGCRYGIVLNGSSNYLHDIHCTALYSAIENQLEEMSYSTAFTSNSGNDYYNECYADTYATGWKITTQSQYFLTNCHNYYYNAFLEGAKTQAIWITSSDKVCVDIINSRFSSCRKGTHLFYRLPPAVYNQCVLDDQIHLMNVNYIDNYNTVPSYDLAYCLRLNSKNFISPFYGDSNFDTNKYYLLGEYKITNQAPIELQFKLRNIIDVALKVTQDAIEFDGTPYNNFTREWTFSIAQGNTISFDGSETTYPTYYLLCSVNTAVTKDSAIILDNISVGQFFSKKYYRPVEVNSPTIIDSITLTKTTN